MIVQCPKCNIYYNDEYRSTICPHDAFMANDGRNNFAIHDDAYRSADPPNTKEFSPLNIPPPLTPYQRAAYRKLGYDPDSIDKMSYLERGAFSIVQVADSEEPYQLELPW